MTLRDDELRDLVYSNRRCFRPLKGAMRTDDERCSLPAERFALACRYHITEGEKEAARLAFNAYRAGLERGRVTSDEDDPFPEDPRPRNRRMTKRERENEERLVGFMKDFRLTSKEDDQEDQP